MALSFAPNGRLIASAGLDEKVRLWDVRERAPDGAPLAGHRGSVSSVVFSPDGRLGLSVADDGSASVWLIRAERAITVLQHAKSVSRVVFSPDGSRLAVPERDRRVIRECLTLEAHGYDVTVIAPRGDRDLKTLPGSHGTRLRPLPRLDAG